MGWKKGSVCCPGQFVLNPESAWCPLKNSGELSVRVCILASTMGNKDDFGIRQLYDPLKNKTKQLKSKQDSWIFSLPICKVEIITTYRIVVKFKGERN